MEVLFRELFVELHPERFEALRRMRYRDHIYRYYEGVRQMTHCAVWYPRRGADYHERVRSVAPQG